MILLAFVVLAFSPENDAQAGNRIADGIYLGETHLGGMTLPEAAAAMESYYEAIADSNLSIAVRKTPADVLAKLEAGENVNVEEYDVLYTVDVPISTFGFDYSIEDALRYASTLGQTGKLVERYKLLMDMKYASAQLPLSFSIDGEKVIEYVENVFAPENTREPKDARFGLSNGKVVVTVASQDGVRVNKNLTANSILKAFENGISDNMSCTAVVATSEPRISDDLLKSLSGVVATYTTKFWTHNNESNENRSKNIYRAADLVNGSLVMPGEQMSLNRTIGQRTPERGFFPAHAYQNGRVIDEVGGGICQFATTFYQCLLQTEMQVNVRHQHSMLVDYVPYSQDATLDWGNKDLVFTNNWEYPLYIACSWADRYNAWSTVTVTFFSTDTRPSNRTVEYKSVTDFEKTYGPTVKIDSTLAPGVPTIEGDTLDEVSSHLEKIVRVNGVVQSTKTINKDYYRPLRKTITVGAKGLSLSYRDDDGICKIYDADGNQLLMNYQGMPYYNGHGSYLLAKNYKHDANGYSTSSTPVAVSPSETEPETTQAETTAPDETTEAPTAESETPAPTEPETTAPHEHSWGEWSGYSHNDGSNPSSHTRTRSCSCGETDSETNNCSFSLVDHKDATTTETGYNKYECSYCHFSYTETIPMIETEASTEASENSEEGGNP